MRTIIFTMAVAAILTLQAEAGNLDFKQTKRFEVFEDNLYFNTFLRGPILPDSTSLEMSDVLIFEKHLESHPEITSIVLSGKSGSLRAGQKIIDIVIELALNTVASGPCESVCALIFLSGKNRRLNGAPKLGFHRPTVDGLAELENYNEKVQGGLSMEMPAYIERVYEIGQLDTLKTLGLFLERGVTWYFLIQAYESTEMWFPSYEELISANVVTLGD